MAQDQQGGFDCEFVAQPPKAFQSECPVCLQVLREPYQTTCCGKSYCRGCIEQLKARNNICACCKSPIKEYPNVGLKQSLYDFKVYCSHKSKGCGWTGELRELDNHLNINPSEESQFEGCHYTHIRCIYCSSKQGQRSVIQTHQTKECPKRPFKCKYCNKYDSYYEDVAENHWPQCDDHPKPCPNKCGDKLSRRNIDDHIANKCPLAQVECDFKHAGCKAKLLRKDVDKHYDENTQHHLSLLAVEQQSLAESLETDIHHFARQLLISQVKPLKQRTRLVCENSATHMRLTTDILGKLEKEKKRPRSNDYTYLLHAIALSLIMFAVTVTMLSFRKQNQEIATLALELKAIQSHVPICPINITFYEFEQRRIMNNTWYSPPFYTHLKGYKICLAVDANGKGEGMGKSVSVFLHMMRGQFDDELQWPFRGRFTIKLLSQLESISTDETYMYHFDFSTHNHTTNRVVDNEMSAKGWGVNDFASHISLQSKFLKDNRLMFSVKYKG